MIKVENIDVYNLARAIYNARNAHGSWDQSDSDIKNNIVGKNDLALAKKLFKGGGSERKFMRQIFVVMDLTAPIYLWKQIDQYRINVTTNSTSTMHSIHKKKFELDDFSHEHLESAGLSMLNGIIDRMNIARDYYNGKYDAVSQEAIDKKAYWYEMIQLLPSSYNQMRTLSMTYENAVNIIQQRAGHKLDDWRNFVEILKGLPYLKEIMEG